MDDVRNMLTSTKVYAIRIINESDLIDKNSYMQAGWLKISDGRCDKVR